MISNEPVVQALSRLLADTHTLYLETHNYRWLPPRSLRTRMRARAVGA